MRAVMSLASARAAPSRAAPTAAAPARGSCSSAAASSLRSIARSTSARSSCASSVAQFRGALMQLQPARRGVLRASSSMAARRRCTWSWRAAVEVRATRGSAAAPGPLRGSGWRPLSSSGSDGGELRDPGPPRPSAACSARLTPAWALPASSSYKLPEGRLRRLGEAAAIGHARALLGETVSNSPVVEPQRLQLLAPGSAAAPASRRGRAPWSPAPACD